MRVRFPSPALGKRPGFIEVFDSYRSGVDRPTPRQPRERLRDDSESSLTAHQPRGSELERRLRRRRAKFQVRGALRDAKPTPGVVSRSSTPQERSTPQTTVSPKSWSCTRRGRGPTTGRRATYASGHQNSVSSKTGQLQIAHACPLSTRARLRGRSIAISHTSVISRRSWCWSTYRNCSMRLRLCARRERQVGL